MQVKLSAAQRPLSAKGKCCDIHFLSANKMFFITAITKADSNLNKKFILVFYTKEIGLIERESLTYLSVKFLQFREKKLERFCLKSAPLEGVNWQ